MKSTISTSQAKKMITDKLSHFFGVSPADATDEQFYKAVAMIVRDRLSAQNSEFRHVADGQDSKQIYYLCMEFLMGRSLRNNLYNLGLVETFDAALDSMGVKLEKLYEQEPDAGLGNGGLGRLAACFLDSAATQEVPLDGYGIRYKYGLFKQLIENGYQVETADNWQRFEDPWCNRVEDEAVTVSFKGQTVKAVPYDMAVIGCKTTNINTLRLWQAEAVNDFDFTAFNNTEYNNAVQEKNDAENITKVLYPNDNKYEGKVLRLKQQYFFCSASLQDIMRRYKKKHGNDFSFFAKENTIQLNDTHPVSCVPELVRLLMNEGFNFDDAFEIARKTFNYTNHTVLGEALEKWPADLMTQVIPEIYHIICLIANKCQEELTAKGVHEDTKAKMSLDDLFSQIQSGNMKELDIIVKADVQGSVEAVKQSLVKLSNEEVVVKVIHGGVGAINESDVILASASNAIIIGFNVRPDPVAKATADREGVDIRLYKVIYNAIEDVSAAMKGMLDPVFEEKVIGHAEIRQIFKASGVGNIAGSYVLDGFMERGCRVRISREGEQIFEGDLASLKRFKDDVKEVKTGYECGLVFDGFNDIQELDIVEAYKMVEVPR